MAANSTGGRVLGISRLVFAGRRPTLPGRAARGACGLPAPCPAPTATATRCQALPRLLLVLSLWLVGLGAAWADTFKVTDIRIEGLQRISAGTVFSLLPVKIGDSTTDEVTAKSIRALYASGFFEDVKVEREGTVLVVTVQERPTVAEIILSGNKDLDEEQLRAALKEIGLAEGRVFDKAILDRIEQELKNQYFSRGKYGVEVQTTVSPLERNRVRVTIDVIEGLTARIKQINIIGNEAFPEKELLGLFKLGKSDWLSWYSKNDQYSKQKLGGDLESLRSFYLDRGFIKFEIKSTQVSISADRKDIYITVVIKEGDIFLVSDIQLAGEPTLPTEEVFPLIHMRRNEPFSRKATTQSAERISRRLADEGYAFANVNTIPEVDEEKQEVKVIFFVDPGKRVYVRRVNMKGNTKTRDEVLRREMRQLEASWFSSELVRESRERLQRLGFFDDVSIETPAVPGSPDQVDVDVTVKEKPSGNLMAGVGYSQTQGIIFNTSVTQNNFLGTGKRVSFAFNTSDANRVYELGYNNPYYTINGISRGFTLSYRETNYENLDLARYSTDQGIAGINFGLPISDVSRASLGLQYQYIKLKPGDSVVADEFVLLNGDTYNDYVLNAGYLKDSRDTTVFPTKGVLQNLALELSGPGSDLEYWRLTYRHRHYFPLARRYTLNLRADLGYGDGYGDATSGLPFFENFYAGGPRSVRGWQENTLGPREVTGEQYPIGGNIKIVGSAELFMPPPISGDLADTIRISAFFDFGNVWTTNNMNGLIAPDGFDLGDLRYSAGVSLVWLSPVGVIFASAAYPMNEQEGDDTQIFQFGLGQNF